MNDPFKHDLILFALSSETSGPIRKVGFSFETNDLIRYTWRGGGAISNMAANNHFLVKIFTSFNFHKYGMKIFLILFLYGFFFTSKN